MAPVRPEPEVTNRARLSDSEPGVDVSTCQSDGEQVSMSFGRQPGEDDATARARFRADTFAQEEATRSQISSQRFVQEEEAIYRRILAEQFAREEAAEAARIHAAHRQSDSEPGVDVSTCQSDGEQVSFSCESEDAAAEDARIHAAHLARAEAARARHNHAARLARAEAAESARIRAERFVQEEEAGTRFRIHRFFQEEEAGTRFRIHRFFQEEEAGTRFRAEEGAVTRSQLQLLE
jgi:hypothetical protein